MAPQKQDWERFVATVLKKGKGRIVLEAEIISGGRVHGTFQGEYVAFRLGD